MYDKYKFKCGDPYTENNNAAEFAFSNVPQLQQCKDNCKILLNLHSVMFPNSKIATYHQYTFSGAVIIRLYLMLLSLMTASVLKTAYILIRNSMLLKESS